MGLVLGPDGQPEAYTWAVLYWTGEVVQEQQPGALPELTFSVDVDPYRVEWIALMSQSPGLAVIRCHVPPGAKAHFWRRRTKEGVVGVTGSERYLGSLHEIGWQRGTETPTSLYVSPDGSVVFGLNDGKLAPEFGA